jgi:hypothetical protein
LRRGLVSLLLLLLILVAFAARFHADGDETEEAIEAVQAAVVDPARIEGHDKCIDCHATEVKAWLASKHATQAFDLLRTAPTSREYAKKLGIRQTDIARKSVCVNCHATPKIDRTGRSSVLSGVSCEACHNASGGKNGWLNPHAVYGRPGTRRGQELTSHYAQRTATCKDAGQFRSADLYQLAKRCFDCHVVSNEDLADAGHDHGDGFELAGKMLGEVRHNFFLQRSVNAETATLWTDSLHHGQGRTVAGRKRVIFIVGQLVDLETSLRSLATATDDNDFSDLIFDRIDDAFGLLAEDLLEEVRDTELPEIEQVVQVVEPVFEKLDDDGFDPDDRQTYLDAADEVGKAARRFAQRDGNQLEEIDDLGLVPEGPFERVYQP